MYSRLVGYGHDFRYKGVGFTDLVIITANGYFRRPKWAEVKNS